MSWKHTIWLLAPVALVLFAFNLLGFETWQIVSAGLVLAVSVSLIQLKYVPLLKEPF